MPQSSCTATQGIPTINVKHLKQELARRGLPTDGHKATLITRLQQATKATSNEDFRAYYEQKDDASAGVASAEKEVTEIETEVAQLQAQLATAQERLAAAMDRVTTQKYQQSEAQQKLKELEPRLHFSRQLSGCVLLSILGQLGKGAGQRAGRVCREWRGSVATAKGMGMYDSKVISVAAGYQITAVCTSTGDVFTFGGLSGEYDSEDEIEFAPELGHREVRLQLVPRLIEALAGKKVIGVAAGVGDTAVWTEAGELFTFGDGLHGMLGHGGEENEYVPRLVEALAGKKVIGAAAGSEHTAAWTEEGELFTFGAGDYGRLGHGGSQTELVPRLVEALAGKKVIGAAAGSEHTAVWTEAGELCTFGDGQYGTLGHGGEENEYVPRLVEVLAGKKVIGAAAADLHTIVWTEAGELFTFGGGGDGGRLGHGGEEIEYVPRLVEALAGKKVIGAAAGIGHTAVWTEAGELFTFGDGDGGTLGHGGEENEYVPRLVEALAGKKVIGAAAYVGHTAVWTEAGELFTFGDGDGGRLGHGGEENEYVPRLVEVLAYQ